MTNGKRTIGKLAAQAGVGIEMIRYYERRCRPVTLLVPVATTRAPWLAGALTAPS
jgi:hypothetical protein